MRLVWISEPRAIISLYNINLTDFCNWDGVCLLPGTDWVFIYVSLLFVFKRLNNAYVLVQFATA
jgi:hypothetical protein